MDKISVIIPTRNRWKLLNERAIPSVQNQTYQNWELIIVDESDYGHTYSVHQDSKIKSYHIEKTYTYPKDDKKAEWLAGPCLALNEALKHVTGDYCIRIDDDDILLPDALENLLYFAKNGNYDFVSADYQIVYPNRMESITPHDEEQWNIGGVQTWLFKSWLKKYKYDPYCWVKPWNANNEYDWFARVLQHYPELKRGILDKVVTIIKPRPGETEVGSKAYVKA